MQTDDAMLLCQADGIDALIEVTGTVEFIHVVDGSDRPPQAHHPDECGTRRHGGSDSQSVLIALVILSASVMATNPGADESSPIR